MKPILRRTSRTIYYIDGQQAGLGRAELIALNLNPRDPTKFYSQTELIFPGIFARNQPSEHSGNCQWLHRVLRQSYSNNMLGELLDALFPRQSIHDPQGFWLSAEDWSALPFKPYQEGTDELTSRGLGSLDSLLSAFRYHDSKILRQAITVFKYKKVPGLHAKLADFLVRATLPHVHYSMVLTPVPLHISRHFKRGFNQAELLTSTLARAMDLPQHKLLWRTQDTGHQAWRSRFERMEAMRQVFRVTPWKTIPEHVVLVDDIATTGATLDACAEVLKRAGAKRVDAWVIARA